MMCRVHVLALEVLVLLLYALNQPSHCTASGWFGGDNAPAAEPVGCSPASGDSCRSAPGDSGEFNPYSIIGVPTDASEEVIVKAYRKLARRWHPDRNRGSEEAQAVFATIAQAYDVLTDTEKREIYDRLGERGLERLRDGDPSVKKDWLPPDEVLRRIHNDGDEPWHQWLVTSTFASLSSLIVPARDQLRWLPIFLGLETEFPWVGITATDSTGQSIATGATTNIGVTFKFQLSGKSSNFVEADVNHNCPEGSRFLGMKTTYYLECKYSQGLSVAISVDAEAFTVAGHREYNQASEIFTLDMV